MLLFLIRRFFKDLGNLDIPLFLRFAGIEGVPIPGLRLSRKGGKQVFLSTRSL